VPETGAVVPKSLVGGPRAHVPSGLCWIAPSLPVGSIRADCWTNENPTVPVTKPNRLTVATPEAPMMSPVRLTGTPATES
jgi:hypothetical protein